MSLELVRMRHPELHDEETDLSAFPVTTVTAFNDVWADKGWELDESSVAAATPLEDLTVPQLRERAGELGVDIESGAKKADIIAALAAHQEG